ncbi:STAS/SEC14 domain-containing protein [Hymenobacter sp. HD11105]
MTLTAQYFHNAAAAITHHKMGYIRITWQSAAVSITDLQAIYEHVLRAMLYYGTTRLMSVHGERPPMPAQLQDWLAQQWIPRAIKEAGYDRCAIVEAEAPVSRLAARSISSNLSVGLRYRYFTTEQEAIEWLR